jgi:hypothetical protein
MQSVYKHAKCIGRRLLAYQLHIECLHDKCGFYETSPLDHLEWLPYLCIETIS